MNKKLLCAVLLMLAAVAIVCHGEQPPVYGPDARPPGKRSFKTVIKKREYCAKAKRVCSPVEDSLSDEPALTDFSPE